MLEGRPTLSFGDSGGTLSESSRPHQTNPTRTLMMTPQIEAQFSFLVNAYTFEYSFTLQSSFHEVTTKSDSIFSMVSFHWQRQAVFGRLMINSGIWCQSKYTVLDLEVVSGCATLPTRSYTAVHRRYDEKWLSMSILVTELFSTKHVLDDIGKRSHKMND